MRPMAMRRMGGLPFRIAFLSGIVAIAVPVQAAIVNLSASKDNTLFESSTGALSNGAGPNFFAGNTGTNLIRRGLIAFDIAGALPAGATIDSVTLTLNVSLTLAGPETISMRRVLQDWGQGASNSGSVTPGGGAPAAPGDATWLHTFFNTSTWTTVGGTFSTTTSASTSVGGNGSYSWTSVQLRADVQDMLDNPGAAFGWGILGNESGPSTAKRFESRESLSPALAPVLRVEYTPVPEPASLAALAFGLAAWRRLRRK